MSLQGPIDAVFDVLETGRVHGAGYRREFLTEALEPVTRSRGQDEPGSASGQPSTRTRTDAARRTQYEVGR